MKLFYLVAIIVVALLTLSPFWLLDAADPDQYKGKIVRFDSYRSPIKSLDPATCGDVASSSIQGNIYEGLYTYHFLKRPAHSSVIPNLAAEMPEMSADRLTYRIKLKSGVKFHRNPCFGKEADGRFKTRTVTAHDFVLSFKRIADSHVQAGLSWAFASRIKGLKDYRKKIRGYDPGDFSRYDLPVEGVVAIDDLTLELKVEEPFPQFLYVLATHLYAPVPREAIDYWFATEDDGKGGRRRIDQKKADTEFREAYQLVGTGPYLLTTFKRKQRIVLERNPDYRDDFYPSEGAPGDREAGLLKDAGKKVPFIDALHYDFVPEAYSSWMLFLTKRTDAAGIPKETFDSVVNPDKKLEDKWRKKRIKMLTYSSPAVYWIVFNMEDPVVGASKSLRQALCAAFDVESYIKVLMNGRGKRAVNIVPSSFKGWKEAGPGPYYKLDLELAKKKIAEAKKELAAKGLLDKDGRIPELAIDIGGTDRSAARQGEFFQQQFSKIDVRLKINLNDWNTQQERVHNKATQMYAMGWHSDYPDAENFLQLYYSPNIDKDTNNANYSNPAFDELYEKIRIMSDTPERTKIYAQMINIISEDCPALMLTEPVSYVLMYDWISNVKPHPVGYGYTKYLRLDAALRHTLGGREK